MDLYKVYSYALQREREGRDFYAGHARTTGHAATEGVFEHLAAEEEKHIAYVQGLLDSLQGRGEATAGPFIEQDESRFGSRSRAEALEQSVIESMIPDVTVLRVAYLIERDFAEFYEMAASKAADEAKRALSILARWERGHETLFKQLHDKVYEQYMQMPWGG